MADHAPQQELPTAPVAPAARFSRSTLIHLLVLTGATFALYAQTLRNGFVADDNDEILRDLMIRSLANIPQFFSHSVWFYLGAQHDQYYRPLKLALYSVEYRLFHFHPFYWHLVNVVFYAATVVVVYWLVRDMASRHGGQAAELGFWTALFFAFHPVHVEVVAWVAAGNDLLCGLALLLALWLYHRARAGSGALWQYGLSVALFSAGLFFKEVALTFPAIVLAYDFLYRGESLRAIARAWMRYVPYLAALGMYLASRWHALGGFAPSRNGYHSTLTGMILSVPVFLCRYVGKSLVPTNLNFWYTYALASGLSFAAVGATAAALALVAAVFWLRRRQPVLSFALAWFLLTLVPVLYLSKVSLLFTDRYLYAPSFGFSVFAAWGWLWLSGKAARAPVLRLAASAGLVALFVFYSFVILRRLPAWRDDVHLWVRTAQQSPRVARVLGQAGWSYVRERRFDDALPYSERAVELDPKLAYVWNDMANIAMQQGRSDEALRDVEKAVQLQPAYPVYLADLAIIYQSRQQWDKAVEACQRGLAVIPNYHPLLNALGLSLWHLGQRDQALAAYRSAIQADPMTLDSYINLANAYAQLHQLDAAIAEFHAALRANPDSPDLYIVHFELGVIYESQSQWRAAAIEYQQALRLNPQFATARANLQPLLPFLTNPNLTETPLRPLGGGATPK
ncbi:MAG TPA: tetratricopeptide repeat protein [Candidatus Acidoferrales bacterium]|nr:tetratricopeptide repeat protein [Candidatus Acidoferrales bacterium]